MRRAAMMLMLIASGLVGFAAVRYVAANQVLFGLQTSASPVASPMASPGASPAAAQEITIEMVDMAFIPPEFTIPANTDVTVILPNTGYAVHSFVITDHKNEGKANLNIRVEAQPGETTTTTINAPAGDYYIWCDIPDHELAGMVGTLHVQ